MSYAKTALKGLVYSEQGKAAAGYTLFAPCNHDVWLINEKGEIVNRWQVPTYVPGSHAELMENGHLLYLAYDRSLEDLNLIAEFAGMGGTIMELDWDSNLIWKLDIPYQHHSFAMDSQTGNIIVSTYSPAGVIPKEIASRIGGGLPGSEHEGNIYSDILYEINRKGEIVWEWKAYEHLDPEQDAFSLLERRVIWPYINSLKILPNGELLFSSRHTSTVFKLNRKTGEITGRYGKGQLSLQHDARPLPNGNFTVFDNGIQRHDMKPYHSRVVEIDPKTDSIVWEYTAPVPSDFFSPICSGAIRLKNGNTFICEAMTGRVFQVTPEKEIVWEYVSPFMGFNMGVEMNFLWDAYFYDPEYPGLKGKDLSPARFKKENRLYGPPAFVTEFTPVIL